MIKLLIFEKWLQTSGGCHWLAFKKQYVAYTTLNGVDVSVFGDTEELAIINLYFRILNASSLVASLTISQTYQDLLTNE